jgi:hypothetical protein
VFLLTLIEDFIQDEPTIDTQFSPQRHFADTHLDREGDWLDLVESLEERYTVDSEMAHRVVNDDRNKRPLDPTIIASIDKTTRLPGNDDYPLWRVRCKVFLIRVIFLYDSWYLSSQARKKQSYFPYLRRWHHGMNYDPPSHITI